jgi:CelD/BcsL family acetyltransferase involved in cellulose biosynthesis
MQVRAFTPADDERWDAFCAASYNATFLHTRRFLSYHGDRWTDRSLVIETEGEWLGVLPLAQDPDDAACAVSHPGITYGGLLHQGLLRGEAMVQALQAACHRLRGHGYRRLRYKPVPTMYHLAPAQDDLYALFRLQAVRVRCDLSSCIALARPLPRSERRERTLKKAQRAGLAIGAGPQHLADLWPVLADNLQRHGVRPVHSVREITLLAGRFPQQIACWVARLEKQVVAGLVLFLTPACAHAQYIASNAEGQAMGALDLLFDTAIREARAAGAAFFDFGHSNEQQGRVLNEGLHRFKSEFGAGGVVHEYHEITL